MRESSESPQPLPRRPAGEAVMYGIGKFIEKRTPTANAEFIEGIIASHVIPKLSPKQVAWVAKHRDAVETACVVGGVGMTVGEIALAVAIGAKAVKFARERTGGMVRTVKVPVLREVPGSPVVDATRKTVAATVAGGLGVAALVDKGIPMKGTKKVKFIDYPDQNRPFGFTKRQLWEIHDEIESLQMSHNPRDQKRAEQLLKLHWQDLEPLAEEEAKKHDRRMRQIGRAVEKHWQDMADKGDKTEDWEGMLTGLRQFRHLEKDGAELQYSGGNEDATPVDREARVSEAKAYERQYNAKKKKERQTQERRRARRIALASNLGISVRWNNPELVGSLEEARRGRTPEDIAAVRELAGLLDRIAGRKDNDPWIRKLLAHAVAARRFHDQDGLAYATEQLLIGDVDHGPSTLANGRVAELARYWRTMGVPGLDVLMPESNPTTDRRHLIMMMENRNPADMAHILLERIRQASDFDEDMPFVVGDVAREGATVMRKDYKSTLHAAKYGVPHPSPSLLHMLRRGYRLLLSTMTDEERSRLDKLRAERGNTYEYRLLPEEEKAIERVGVFIVQNNPDGLLAPVVNDPKFSDGRRNDILTRQTRGVFEKIRGIVAAKEVDDARWKEESDRHLIGSIVRDMRRQYEADPAGMRKLLERLERRGGWVENRNGRAIPNAELYTLMRRAYRNYKINEDMPWQRSDDDVARDLARIFANDGGPGLSELFALYK